jgi:polyhydroxyalkanoate synthase
VEILTPESIEEALTGGEVGPPVDVLGIADSLLQVARRTATTTAPRRALGLGKELAAIALGRSSVAPEPRDWRFKNRAWSEHPVFRRLGQGYLAWSDTLDQLVADADLDWRAAERARFATGLLTSALSPTNSFLLNPDALERAWETAGRSAWRGVANFGRDVMHNRGLPRSVDAAAFTVGKNLAATPGSVVYRSDVCELIQYAPTTATVRTCPIVVVPPQINKYYVMDLAPGRSFVEYAVSQGFTVFMVSWRNPLPEHGSWGLDTYIDALQLALEAAAAIARTDSVSAVAVCSGGLTTASLLGHLAAKGVDLVNSATFAVTLLEFAVPSTIGMLGTQRLVRGATKMSGDAGVLDGHRLGLLFAMLRPNDLIWNYWVSNNLLGETPPRFDVLAWNADGIRLPSALHADFLDMLLDNTLVEGQRAVHGSPVDLGKVEIDNLVVAAQNDHLTPWKGCYATTGVFGGRSEFVLSSSGHIQSLVNPPGNPKMSIRVGGEAVPDPDEWLAGSEQRPGTWWDHWVGWMGGRAGKERPARTTLGDAEHPVIEPAPGRYVREP